MGLRRRVLDEIQPTDTRKKRTARLGKESLPLAALERQKIWRGMPFVVSGDATRTARQL